MELAKGKVICNLSRFPLSINKNPYYLSAKHENYDYIREWYLSTEPKCLSDIFGVKTESMDATKASALFIPWVNYKPISIYKDKSFWGNIKYVEAEVSSFKCLCESIRDNGYKPEEYAEKSQKDIKGYYLKRGNCKRLYIVGGNHRAAILAALEIEIPFEFKDVLECKSRELQGTPYGEVNYPKIFDAKDVDGWPSVSSGFISREEAEKIFDQYFTIGD